MLDNTSVWCPMPQGDAGLCVLSSYCVTGFSFGCTKLTTLFALLFGRKKGDLHSLCISSPLLLFVCCLSRTYYTWIKCWLCEAELNKMPVFILRDTASGFRACGGMGNLTLFSWETGLVFICGQLFALQSVVPSEMHDCVCTGDDQIKQELRLTWNFHVT